MRRPAPPTRAFVNGKWLAQPRTGTQRYVTQVVKAVSTTPTAERLTLVVPRDATVPPWAGHLRVTRSRLRGFLFEQVALPWLTRRGHLFSLGGPAPLLKRDQTVVMHDAMPFRWPSTFRPAFVLWYRFLYLVLARTAKRLLTVSSFSRSELARVLRVPETRFDLAPCGADHVGTSPPRTDVSLPFPRGTYALLVGNLAPHKNVPATLTALADAGVPVVVVGAEHRNVFRGRTRLDERDGVRFLGAVSDAVLEALYAGAGVFVAPSRYEGFGIPIVEAGRLGCPSVFATGSAMGQVAGDGGLGFDPDDLPQCVQLVASLLDDGSARADLAERARGNARRFTWACTARQIFETERGAAGGREVSPDRLTGLRVLHVTETFAAGTGVAIVTFARATRDQGVVSFLVAQDRGSGLLDEVQDDPPFDSAELLYPGLLHLWRGFRTRVREIRPDIVHVHSSLAGVVVRVAIGFPRRTRVVYSPHCFAFERRDVAPAKRWLFRAAEWLLARRTDLFVCVSPYEADLARGLGGPAQVNYVVNTMHSRAPRPLRAPPDCVVRLVSVGRITPQKDPALFARIVTALRSALPGTEVEATWIGTGDDTAAVTALEQAGVRITGWVPASEVTDLLAGQSVYVHTAAWEAATPIAVLDAMACGLVVAVRRNDAYRDMLPADWLFDDVTQAVDLIRRLADPPVGEARAQAQFDTLAALRAHGPDVVLARAYRELRSLDRRHGRVPLTAHRGARHG